ncbi:transposase IS66 family protein [archaeon BMS3Bbin15]|nr:transposase IS66 family protein [archaeon BMS3Bbin15]
MLDGVTGRVIAEELLNKKDPDTIKEFLGRHLDPDRVTFVVTDLYPSYPEVFMEFFGENLIHQFCLMHLNKLIVQDFQKKPSIEELHTMYRLLNIFYNRDQELEVLGTLAEKEKEKTHGDEEEYKAWLTKARSIFRAFVYELKLKRRRDKKNLEQRPYLKAVEIFKGLMDEIDSFDTKVRKRLRKIEKNWDRFTAFYFVEGAPATNNPIENYYSTSLKTHRKRQFRSDEGIENQMKLSQMKQAGMLEGCKRTLLEVFYRFRPFLAPG